MLFLILATALLQGSSTPAPDSSGVRNPTFSRDGRLAVSVAGDIWVVAKSGAWQRVTSGPAWDREPAWTPDGAAIVFSSDRSGKFDLWRVAMRADQGTEQAPERLTSSSLADAEPTVLRDGRIVFVRGRLGAARLWVRSTTGSESRLTKDSAVEEWPAASPDGARIAYVSIAAASRKLHVLTVDNGQDSTVLTDARVERPTWSPAGDRLAWTATGPRGAVYVSPLDGHYVNVASARHAESTWNPDGKTMTVVDLPPAEPIAPVGYNGDPDRTGDREANLLSSVGGRMWTIAAPISPDLGLVEQQGSPAIDRAMHNADTFDQLWDRTAALYYSSPDAAPRRAQWESLKAKYRPRAVAAKTDDELASVLHDLLREHPPYKQAATGRAAVSSAHPVATAAGVEMLAKGGNVVDAAVAVSFALGVVEPDASGPGGYGQMLVYTQGLEKPQLIEFMTRVPEDAGLTNTSLLTNGRLPDGGPAVANVPGTVAAMYLAWQKFGSKKIPWADLLQPAIRAARDGYAVSEGLATTLATEREQFLKYDGSRALFFRDGEPLHAGDTVKNPDLAWTLEQIARGGADAFYKGEIATKMVADLRAHGNVMKASDLARYFAAEREPVSSTYRGYTLFSSAPPVAGGAELAAKLNSLEAFGSLQPYPDDATSLHAMIARVAARAVDAQPHRRPGALVDERGAVHEQGHRAGAVALLRPRQGDQPRDAAQRHAPLRRQREDGERRAGASARVHRPRLRRQPGRVVPSRGNDGVRRRRRGGERRGRDADARHVGREFLRVAGAGIHLQRQAVVVRNRAGRLRLARALRAARQHHRSDDRLRGQRTVATRRDGRRRRRQRVDYVGRL